MLLPQFPTTLTGPSLYRNTLELPFEKRNKVCFQLEGHYTLNMHPVRCEAPPECLAMGGGGISGGLSVGIICVNEPCLDTQTEMQKATSL